MPYSLGEDEVDAVRQVIEKGYLDRYINGDDSVSSQFEKEFSKKLKVKYSLAVSSGTAALICGLAGMCIGPGDEVIIPAFTYIATALSVLAVGAIPVIAEIDTSLTINPEDVKRKITKKTKAIIPVHMHGLPCNMTAIMQIAKRYKLLVLEDVAQACGGSYGSRRLGTIGDAGIFSFNHYKIITCGEGGALITDKKIFHHKAIVQHHGGCIFEPGFPKLGIKAFAGWNFRISEISSAILRVQLNKLDSILKNLREEKRAILDCLSNVVSPFTFCPIHDEEGDCGRAVFLQFTSHNQANTFFQKMKLNNINAWFVNTKGHVYSDWEPILKKRGAHHTQRDPFHLSKTTINISKNSFPQTSSILERVIGISTQIGRSKKELRVLTDALCNTIKESY
ncbi:MAG: DegT/DnrJ/EryC1/StrS family aminotransferase [Candidatus Rickettsiella isopodorum]|nr:DegT/DnrJ/EryC1/StrS family aminotransferase [Candidatus Rickettsiella isopodorum]